MESVIREGGHCQPAAGIREYYFGAVLQSGLDMTAFRQLVEAFANSLQKFRTMF